MVRDVRVLGFVLSGAPHVTHKSAATTRPTLSASTAANVPQVRCMHSRALLPCDA